jgi:predicted phage terminase large subunit-like protein
MTSKERLERIQLLKKHAGLLKTSWGSTPTQADLAKYYEILKEIEKVQRIEDSFKDIMVFAKNYFTGKPPHDLLKADTPSPAFHYELAEEIRQAIFSPITEKIVAAAPRSHAKSTLVTNLTLLYIIAYQEDILDPYWIIVSDKQDNARKFLDVIKSEIEDNELFIEDFGNLKGATWNSLEIVTANGVKMSAHGAGEALRGLKFGSFRPNAVLDDIESDESCSTADRIEKIVDWFDRTVLPLGDPKRMKCFFVGTVIHYNSLLSQVINNRGDWKAFKYKAIEQFPERMDLWNKWEEMYHDRSEGRNPSEAARIARDNALDFYAKNKAIMDAGSQVLWEERINLVELMEKRAQRRLAFNSEYQNEPIDEATRIFSKLHYFEPDDVRISDLDIYGACDPSMGQSKRSDPSVIITVGRHKKTGVVYVLDVDVKRRHPDQIIQDIFKKANSFNYVMFSIETIAFQQFMKDELMKRSAEQGIYLPLKEFKSTVKKEIRITSIEPLMTSGYIRILPTQRDLIEQLEYFPKSSHDDAIDALSQVMELAKRKGSGLVFAKF